MPNQLRRLRAAVLVLFVILTGCATCREYPVACGVAVAIVAGSIAAAVENRAGNRSPFAQCPEPPHGAVLRHPCP